ncbi:hypothetical protein MSEO_00050 [Mycobacterium seoulense]|uniref:Ribosome small subunit-dependent GTPase A n=1 Tax=Mycobacterium seoulense TaxID=386911 RepID=A0A7I7NS51_9MYCO|nr:hypothetical protein MSEO_00050 [Mycobacterium seoulense]
MRPGDYDESDVRVRSGRGSRPRTKTRPEHADAEPAMVISVDRGRWGCVLGGDPDRRVTAMRARELGRTPIVVGDEVDIVGDLSGRLDTLARIVRRGERRTVLRHTADDTDPTERVVVANADQLLIVVALADPPPRTGLVDRALIAAFAGGLTPILCLTKTDLAPPEPFAAQFVDLDLTVVVAGRDDPLLAVADLLAGKITVLLGHSGVGKSTLVNRLVPEAERAVGEVTDIGRGRHTSTQSVALPLATSGWVVDTPGIRSFGLAHIQPDDVLMAFSDLAEAIENCPRGCGHMGPPADPECALDTLSGPPPAAWGPRAGCWPRSTRLSQPHAQLVGRNQMPFGATVSTPASAPHPDASGAGGCAPAGGADPLEHRPHHRHEVDAGLGEHIFLAAALPGLVVRPALQAPARQARTAAPRWRPW